MKKVRPDRAQMQQMSRFVVFQRESVSVEERAVKMAFSSEEPVEHWSSDEVLSYTAGTVDLNRPDGSGVVLFGHDRNDQIDAIERAWIDVDKHDRALVRSGSGTKTAEKLQGVQDGILHHTSVGYRVEDMVSDNPNTDGGDYRYVAACWMPYEISFAAVPADPTAGVGRSAEPFIENPVDPTLERESRNTDKNQVPADTETPVVAIPAVVATDTSNTAERGMQNERACVSELLAIGHSYATHDGIEAVEKVIKEDGSEARLRTTIMANIRTEPIVTADEIGMADKEQCEFSLLRAMPVTATGRQDKAGLEREVLEELERRHGHTATGFFVPTDLIAHVCNKGNVINGGNVIGNDFREDLFIELLHSRFVVAQLGVIILGGLVGDITTSKHLIGNTAQQVDENGSATGLNAVFGQMSLKPKTVTVSTGLSRKSILQSSLSVEQFTHSESLKAMMLSIDLATIDDRGTGSEPTGILNTVGIGTVGIGVSGGVSEWKHIVALESIIAAANADIGNLTHIANVCARGLLKTKLGVDGVSGYIRQDGVAPLNGYRCAVPNQISSNLVRGTTANKCSPLIPDNQVDLMVVYWGVLNVVIDPYTKPIAGAVRITTLQDVDVAVRHVESFAVIKDIVAT